MNDGSNRYPQTQDPGEIENRLSLNPSDPDFKDFVGNWEDGQEYTMTVTVRQISPGEFEVMSAVPKKGREEPDEPDANAEDIDETGGAAPDETDKYGTTNPAVVRMMTVKKK